MATLLLFTKRPAVGRVKSRLVPPLNACQASELYHAFVADQIQRLRRLTDVARPELCVDELWDPAVSADLDYSGIEAQLQGEGDLGQRLGRAFRRLHGAGHGPVLVFAVDAPTVSDETLREALRNLDSGKECVLAPSRDGGYILLGTRRHFPELFEEIHWGGSTVFHETYKRIVALQVSHTILTIGDDVDDIEGLRNLRRALADEQVRQQIPHTADLVRRLPPELFG